MDPCHWQTSPILESAERIGDFEALADAFSAWWGPDPDEALAGGSYTPPPMSPQAGRPSLHEHFGNSARHIDLQVPGNLVLDDCDGGQYRIWEDQDGAPRLAQPGEQILLRVVQLDAGVVMLEAGVLADASPEVRSAVEVMLNSSYLGPPL